LVSAVDRIREIGIVPVVRATSAAEALDAVEAIRAGGIPILEITLTVPGAVNIIAELTGRLADEALIGAGTVLDAESAQACIDAGAFALGVGADLVDLAALRRGEASSITEKARQYVAAITAARDSD